MPRAGTAAGTTRDQSLDTISPATRDGSISRIVSRQGLSTVVLCCKLSNSINFGGPLVAGATRSDYSVCAKP
jgi:hypothetical protein